MNVEALKDLAAYVTERLDAQIQDVQIAFGELTLIVESGDILDVLSFLKDDVQCQFISFIDICGADYPARDKRFEVVYHLMSPYQNHRIRIKLSTDEDTPVPSATSVFPGADWFEREAYDLYGILFTGHPRAAPHPYRLRLRGASAAQGFPAEPASSRCATTTRSSGSSTNPWSSSRNSAISIFFPPGREPTTSCRATRRRSSDRSDEGRMVRLLFLGALVLVAGRGRGLHRHAHGGAAIRQRHGGQGPRGAGDCGRGADAARRRVAVEMDRVASGRHCG